MAQLLRETHFNLVERKSFCGNYCAIRKAVYGNSFVAWNKRKHFVNTHKMHHRFKLQSMPVVCCVASYKPQNKDYENLFVSLWGFKLTCNCWTTHSWIFFLNIYRHIPKAKATTIAETPETRRIAENTKIQSNVKYHADFEKAKGKLTQVRGRNDS